MAGIGLNLNAAVRSQKWWPEGAALAADFVNGRYMRDGAEVPFAAAFSFARNSPALLAAGGGRWANFDAGQLRRQAGLGALLEPATTNQSRGTIDIGGGGWTMPAGLSRTGNGSDGFVFSVGEAATGLLALEQYGNIDIPANEPGFFSFDLHDSGLRGAALWFSNVGYRADFSTQTGIANGTGENAVASMVALGGGWWRCRVRHVHSAATFAWRLKLGTSRSNSSYAAGDFVRLRLPQVELGRFSAPVVNASLTQAAVRAADQLAPVGGGVHDVEVHLGGGTIQGLAAVSGALPAAQLNETLVRRAFWFG